MTQSKLILARWGLLLALAVLEIIGFTFHIESSRLQSKGSLILELVRRGEGIAGLVITFLTLLLMLLLPKLRTFFGFAAAHSLRHSRWWVFLALHAFTVALFCLVANSIYIQGSVHHGKLAAPVWALLLLFSGLLAALLLALAAAPLAAWRTMLQRARTEVVISLLASVACWAMARQAKKGWEELSTGTFHVVEWLLSWVYPVVISRPEEKFIGTPRFAETIAPACSGYEGIGLIIVFLSLFLWMFRSQLRFPRALLILPAGCLIIWLANGLRIALLIVVGDAISPEIAVGGFHSQTGWLFFCMIALGLAVIALKSRWLSAKMPEEAPSVQANRSVPYLMPFLTLVAGIMFTGMAHSGFDWLYPLRIMVTACVILFFLREYERFDWSWLAVLVGVIVFLLWILMDRSDHETGTALRESALALGSGWTLGWIAFRVIGSVVIVPIAEELAFRGYLLRRILAPDFEQVELKHVSWAALAISSILFGLMHQRWLAGAVAGLFYGLLYYRRGRMADPILAHVVTNGLIAIWVLVGGAWYLWA
jgi:exosortase E/protease (VPEID-CTERM system)